MTETPQSLGYWWDGEIARLVGGERHPGSGNRVYRRLDASGRDIILSGKFTPDRSTRLTLADFDEARSALPNVGVTPILVHKFLGRSGPAIASLDFLQLIAWLREPPQLVPATPMDNLRATASVPPYLR